MTVDRAADASPGNALVRGIRATRGFLVAAQGEMRKVTWPTRPELTGATRSVVIASIVLGVAIGLVDLLLQLIFVRGVAGLAR